MGWTGVLLPADCGRNREAFLKGHKDDRDAEAVQRPTMPFVPTKGY
jgi:hypothetical protein